MKNIQENSGRFATVLITLAAAAALAACGGGGGSSTAGGTPPPVTPAATIKAPTFAVAAGGTYAANSAFAVKVDVTDATSVTGTYVGLCDGAAAPTTAPAWTIASGVASTTITVVSKAGQACTLQVAATATGSGGSSAPASTSLAWTVGKISYAESTYTVFDKTGYIEQIVENVDGTFTKKPVINTTSFTSTIGLALSGCGLHKTVRGDGLVWASCIAAKDLKSHCLTLSPATQELKETADVCPVSTDAGWVFVQNFGCAVDAKWNKCSKNSKGWFFVNSSIDNVSTIHFRANDNTERIVFSGTFVVDGSVTFLITFPKF